MNAFINTEKASRLLTVSVRRVRQMCDDGLLPGAVQVDGLWRIPRTANSRLSDLKGKAEELCCEFVNLPAAKREAALKKLGLIKEFDKFAGAYVRNGGNRTAAMQVFTSQKNIALGSFKRWLTSYKKCRIMGLVDTRGGLKLASQVISPQAFELFKSMYLTEQQLSVKTCWQNIRYVSQQEQRGWIIPTLRTMQRYVNKNIPYPAMVLNRQGVAAYEAKCAPYIQKDFDSIEPGQVWIGDHHQCNCWIRDGGKWVRPWLTAWQDMRSRMIVGWYVSKCPNQTTILLASKRGIEKFGPPDSVKIDNGKDYDSELFTGTTKAKRRAIKKGYINEDVVQGIYAMLDIDASFAIPYHPQSKAIERFFDTLDCQFTKTFKTYCGKDSQRKPEKLNDYLKSEKAIRHAVTIKEFNSLLSDYMESYNAKAHTGSGMNGRSPLEVMSTRITQRVLVDGVLDLLMRVWSGKLKVGKNGVRFKGMYYGQYSDPLMMRQGQIVRVAYDPADMRRLWVYDDKTQLICQAEQNELIRYGAAVTETALRDAMRQKSRAAKISRQFVDTRLAANMDLTTLTIRAMEKAKEPPIKQLRTLRPVRTPVDKQVRNHQLQENLKNVKKAAGAESMTKVLDMNLAAVKSGSKRMPYLGIMGRGNNE